MIRVFIGLGSNLGRREDFLSRAIAALKTLPELHIIQQSLIYESDPVGVKDQPTFLNMVVEGETTMPAKALLDHFLKIEINLGRTKTERWGPREIDLDLLYYGTERLTAENIQIPHPEIAKRRFVLVPMNELAPDFIDPLRNLSIAAMLKQCPDTSDVHRLS